MKNEITHTGLVFDIVGKRIDVAVTPQTECASCKAASLCVAGQSGEKIVSAITEHPEFFSVGEQVRVSAQRGMGIKAVFLAYILPFIVLMAVLIILTSAGSDEAVAGLAALAAVAVYYICLYFFRHSIEREIIFKIDKVND
ncbi:MAG: SoxR reducing system RseC family protein [Alistipes sp.]|nr:SoxR reducing system RseC family protein [Alistipes sp.]